MNVQAAALVYGVSHIHVKLAATVGVFNRSVFCKLEAAVIAVASLHVVFEPATGTPVLNLSARHRYKDASGALNQLQILDDEATPKDDADKSQDAIPIGILLQFEVNTDDFHDAPL